MLPLAPLAGSSAFSRATTSSDPRGFFLRAWALLLCVVTTVQLSGAVQPQISAGGDTSLFLKPDGTVLMVGIHNYETSDGISVFSYTPNPLLTGVKKISAGHAHSMMVKSDGSAWAFGENTSGQLGDGTKDARTTVPVQVMTEVSDVAASETYTLFLKIDGTVWATSSQTGPVQVMTNATAVSARGDHRLFLKSDGSAWASGYNLYGQLGDGTTTNRSTPVQVLTDVVAISAGHYHSLFLKSDGSVWGSGANGEGQLGIDGIFGRTTPALIMTGVTAISAGQYHSLFLKKDGSVWATGTNYQGQLGDGTQAPKQAPVKILDGISAISAGDNHSLFIKIDGTVLACGENYYGRLGTGRVERRLRPVPVMTNIRSIAAGDTQTLFLKNDGVAWAAGANRFGQLGDGTQIQRSFAKPVLEGVAAVAVGSNHSLVLKTNGSVWGSGANYDGQLGLSELYFFTKRFVPILTDVISMAAGDDHNLFVKSDGSAWAIGDNTYGQLGDGTTDDRHTPVQIMSEVAAVAANYSHSFFLKTDGTAWATGLNTGGQLGDGTQAYQHLLPVQVLSGVKAIAAGGAHTLFLKTDGSAWACGQNGHGALGDGTFTTRYSPVKIMTGVAAIAAGAAHSLFLKTDGSVWAAGSNFSGALGDGTTTDRKTPVLVFTGASAISARGLYSVFLKADGSAWATGENEDGQFGDGTALTCLSVIQTGLALQLPQTVSFATLPARFVNSAPIALSATASSGFPVDFQIVSGPATLNEDGITLTLTGQPGTVVIKASQPGATLEGVPYAAASVQRSFSVTKVPQTISFTQPLPTLGIDALPFPLTATATSGLPVSYLVSGPATVSEGQLVLNGAIGTVTITATQPGDATYAAAGQIIRNFTIKAPTLAQTIRFTAPANIAAGSDPVLLTASSSASLPVTLEIVSGGAVFAEDNRTLTFIDTGTIILRATQAGNFDYLPAPPVERVIIIPGNTQKITFASPSPIAYGDAPRLLVATANSGLPVAFELVSGPARIAAGLLTSTGAGPIVVRAVQPGGAGFGPAPAVTRTITINKAALAVSFEPASRLVRQANPVFVPNYTGFIGDDSETDLAATRPLGRTTATAASPAGAYPITFSGGLDANYRFVPGAPAFLTVVGFGGAYEALLVDSSGTPRGKLELTVPANALTYTGTLNLASEPAALSLRGDLSASDGASATGSWSRAADPAKSISALSLGFELTGDTLDGELSVNNTATLSIGSGSRLFVQPVVSGKKQNAPWTGLHTFVLRDPIHIGENDELPLPLGASHASATIASTGLMTLKGKLADGTTVTGTAAADSSGLYRLYVRPYAKRLESFLAGELPLVAHPDQTRFPDRFHVPEGETTLSWAKAASPAKPLDPTYRSGFAAELIATLDPWLAPSPKATLVNGVSLPAGTLAQRLGLTDSPSASVQLALSFSPEDLDFGASASLLPNSLTLTSNGTVIAPANASKFSLKVTPATGAFSGSFVLNDQVAPPPAKPITRKVTISGTLRQGPVNSGASLGHAHFLFDPIPGDSSNEQISGELQLLAP